MARGDISVSDAKRRKDRRHAILWHMLTVDKRDPGSRSDPWTTFVDDAQTAFKAAGLPYSNYDKRTLERDIAYLKKHGYTAPETLVKLQVLADAVQIDENGNLTLDGGVYGPEERSPLSDEQQIPIHRAWWVAKASRFADEPLVKVRTIDRVVVRGDGFEAILQPRSYYWVPQSIVEQIRSKITLK
jgi:hypothetical protein